MMDVNLRHKFYLMKYSAKLTLIISSLNNPFSLVFYAIIICIHFSYDIILSLQLSFYTCCILLPLIITYDYIQGWIQDATRCSKGG